jgi:Concanavalin A-like lectin/glucanases superfamily
VLITGSTTVISQIAALTTGTYSLTYTATSVGGLVAYTYRTVIVTDQLPAYDLNNGYMYLQKTFNHFSGDLTLECWVYLTRMHPDSFGIFDTRSPSSVNVNDVGCVVWFLQPPYGSMKFYDPNTRLAPDFQTNNISVGAWTHIAWVRQSGAWTAYSNGRAGSGTAYTLTPLQDPSYSLILGADATNIRDGSTRYKFEGLISQARISSRAVYIANFTPAQDLTPSATDSSVLFFLGDNGTDTVSGMTLTTSGTVTKVSRTIAT